MRFIFIFLLCTSCYGQISRSVIMNYGKRNEEIQDGLVYGELEKLFPEKSFEEIKVIRQTNYSTLKAILENRSYSIQNKTLEVYIGGTSIKGNLNLNGRNSTIVLYPFVPQYNQPETIFIEPRYGDTHIVKGIKFKTAQKNNLFETYACVLKQPNKIQIIGQVRKWSDWKVGNKLWYAWTRAVLGEVNTIVSVDSLTSIITVNNISASIPPDAQGLNVWVGTSFPESISEQDYLAYGKSWIIKANYTNSFYSTPFPGSAIPVNYTGNFTDVTFENINQQIALSMASGKLNLTRVTFYRGVVSLSFFNRGIAGGQTVTINDYLNMIESGGYVAGAIASLETTGNYGAGGYMHDSIIVKCYGVLNLINNTSASWRQYSSGRGPSTGQFSYYRNINASGSGEYDFYASNTMPTIIDTINSPLLTLLRHSTTINYGSINNMTANNQRYAHGQKNMTFRNVTFTKTINLLDSTDFVFDNCTFNIDSTLHPNVMIQNQGAASGNSVTITNSRILANRFNDYVPGSNLTGTRGGTFFAFTKSKNVFIDNLSVPSKEFTLFSSGQGQSPLEESTSLLTIKNTDVLCYQFCLDNSTSTAGTVSNTIVGENVNVVSEISDNRGKGFIQDIKGKSGSVVKVVGSSTFNNLGTLPNTLEVDFAHDEYITSGTINNIIARVYTGNTKTSANPQYGSTIKITANGNLTLTNPSIQLTNGQSVLLKLDRSKVIKSDSTFKSVTISSKGLLDDHLISKNISIFVGANKYESSNGEFSNSVFKGFVDSYTGRYELRFDQPNLEALKMEYFVPKWINTGVWMVNQQANKIRK